MSRQAFEDWANANRLPFSGAPKGTQFSYDAKLVWQAATNAALERAAKACQNVARKQGTIARQLAAMECGEVVRALKDETK